MLRNYLKVAIRVLLRNRLISFINIFGLGLSLSVAMMIMIRIQDQMNYDRFHPYPDRIFRIISDYHKKTGEHWKMASSPLPLHDKLKEFSGIEASASLYPALGGKAISEGKELYINGAFTESSFFKVFGFTLSAGDASSALEKPGGIVISKATSEKFFSKENPIGKTLTMENGRLFVVTGVLNESPGKSHINYDAYASMSAVSKFEIDKLLPEKSTDWYAFNTAYTYVLLAYGFSPQVVTNDLNTIAAGLNKNNQYGKLAFDLQKITKITPGSDQLYNDIGNGTSWTKLLFEIGVALIILIAACFNYTNLTIARALTRAKEVGVRKINGAGRLQIFLQYSVEAVVSSLLSLGFAWVLLSFIIQYAPFNDGYEFIPSSFRYNSTFVAWTIGFALFTGLLAGISPAWILSSFQPLRVMKSLVTARTFGKVSIQKALIVFQYSLSLTIIIFLLAFYKQFAHLAAADPGFRRDHVLVVPLQGMDEKIAAQKISQVPGVRSVGAMSSLVGARFNGLSTQAWLNSKQDAINLNYYYANGSFVSNLQFSLIAGNNFPSQTERERYLLLNEKAVTALGFKNNQQAVGKKIWINDSVQLEVAGVLKDFHYENAGKNIMPLAMRNKENAFSYLYVSVAQSGKEVFTQRVKQTLSVIAPSKSFDLVWLDDQLESNNSQRATISLLGYLAFMAIAIASLGLLGLVIYTVEVKRKEISIRKIIGAEPAQLVRLLSKGFIKLIFISGLVAVPIGYTLSFLFMLNFANRASFGVWYPLLCFGFLLTLGLVTIFSQTYKAATENPVINLRSE